MSPPLRSLHLELWSVLSHITLLIKNYLDKSQNVISLYPSLFKEGFPDLKIKWIVMIELDYIQTGAFTG
jgi:hypothetical protein